MQTPARLAGAHSHLCHLCHLWFGHDWLFTPRLCASAASRAVNQAREHSDRGEQANEGRRQVADAGGIVG